MGKATIPHGPEELTAAWLTDALRAGGALDARAKVASFTTTTIGEGSGFLGQLAQVSLAYDPPSSGPASLIAKFPAASQAGRDIGNLFDFYHREIRFYDDVAPQIDLRTPRRYFSAMDRDAAEYILLLEDMAPARVGDHAAGCTLAEAEQSVRNIATFHATWWESPKLESFAEWMPLVDAPVHQSAQNSYQQAWGPFVENFGDRLTPKMRKTAEEIGEKVIKLQSSVADRPHTIVHADFRTDNLFFACEAGGEFGVIDWQIACRGRGVFDIAYLLCGGLEPAERRANEERLLRLYHDTLVANGVTGYGFEQCWREYRRMALYVLVYVVISLGTLDFANERGLALFNAWLRRATAAIEELRAAEEMPA